MVKKQNIKSVKEEFADIVKKFKNEKSKDELLKIVSVQPENYELRDFMVARKVLDELGVGYSKSFE